MRVLVTGASGLLGRAIVKAFEGSHEVIGTAFSRATGSLRKLDVTDLGAVRQFILELKPDVIIHSAAERRPDVSEKNPTATWSLNVHAAENIARAAAELNAIFIYPSSDYVFDGTNPPYRPDSIPNPLSQYGKSKLEGEQAVLKAYPTALVIRIPLLYGDVTTLDESSVTMLFKNVLSRTPAKVDDWQQRYPTHVTDVAAVFSAVVAKRSQGAPLSGVYHYSASECFTKYTMAVAMAEVMGLPHDHLTADTSAPPAAAPRPRDTRLDVSALQAAGAVPHGVVFRTAIQEVLRKHMH